MAQSIFDTLFVAPSLRRKQRERDEWEDRELRRREVEALEKIAEARNDPQH